MGKSNPLTSDDPSQPFDNLLFDLTSNWANGNGDPDAPHATT